MQKFTIDMDTWYRGMGAHGSLLLRADGMRCCLGQVAQQCDIPDEALINIGTPRKVTEEHRTKLPAWLFPNDVHSADHHSEDCRRMMHINDDISLTDEQRMRALSEIAAKHDTVLEFTAPLSYVHLIPV